MQRLRDLLVYLFFFFKTFLTTTPAIKLVTCLPQNWRGIGVAKRLGAFLTDAVHCN